VTGVIFAVLAGMLFEGLFNIVFLLKLIYVFAIASLLIAISVYDLKHTIIPDKLVYVLVFLSFASLFANGALSTEALLAGPLTALPLGFLWLVSGGKWMGLGDAKLQLALGWLLGLTQGVSALVLSFWIGAAVSVGVITIPYVIQRMYLFGTVSKLTMKSEIAFGPFLVLGFVITWMFNIDLISLLLFS
jgi:prepilin signal peptidase PulO-like enzyme (type II secretory pathway)